MGAVKVKVDRIHSAQRTRQLLRAREATVSIVQDLKTGRVLSVGLGHGPAVDHLPLDTPEGSWEVKEFPVCR